MTPFQHQLLNERQIEIARAIMAVIHGCDTNDVFSAMLSILAGTLNHVSPSDDFAMRQAERFGSLLLEVVQMGQNGELEYADISEGART